MEDRPKKKRKKKGSTRLQGFEKQGCPTEKKKKIVNIREKPPRPSGGTCLPKGGKKKGEGHSRPKVMKEKGKKKFDDHFSPEKTQKGPERKKKRAVQVLIAKEKEKGRSEKQGKKKQNTLPGGKAPKKSSAAKRK